MRRMAVWAGLVFVLDQVTKWAVLVRLNLDEVGSYDLFPPYLVFRMAWNRGVNFGLFSGESDLARWALVLLALAISAWVVAWVRREGGRGAEFAAGLLVGGATGNALDRILHGAVADFLNMSCCGIRNPYSFNLADVAIFLGAVGLVLLTGGRAKTA